MTSRLPGVLGIGPAHSTNVPLNEIQQDACTVVPSWRPLAHQPDLIECAWSVGYGLNTETLA